MFKHLTCLAAIAVLPAIASATEYGSKTIDTGGGRYVTMTVAKQTPAEQSPYALQGREQQAPKTYTTEPTAYWAGTHFIGVVPARVISNEALVK